MPLTGVHFLLSYRCTHECDHCFVWSSPRAGGTIRLETLLSVLDQAQQVGTVEDVYFEGGEPFLFFPLLVEGIRQAKERGFSTGVVTNGYWATAEADAALWLEPLRELEVADLSVSSDAFHARVDDPRPGFAVQAARRLGLEDTIITIDPPTVGVSPEEKGLPIVGGSVRFRGRAVAELTACEAAGARSGCIDKVLPAVQRAMIAAPRDVQVLSNALEIYKGLEAEIDESKPEERNELQRTIEQLDRVIDEQQEPQFEQQRPDQRERSSETRHN